MVYHVFSYEIMSCLSIFWAASSDTPPRIGHIAMGPWGPWWQVCMVNSIQDDSLVADLNKELQEKGDSERPWAAKFGPIWPMSQRPVFLPLFLAETKASPSPVSCVEICGDMLRCLAPTIWVDLMERFSTPKFVLSYQ